LLLVYVLLSLLFYILEPAADADGLSRWLAAAYNFLLAT
jgi:hypothetical protein